MGVRGHGLTNGLISELFEGILSWCDESHDDYYVSMLGERECYEDDFERKETYFIPKTMLYTIQVPSVDCL